MICSTISSTVALPFVVVVGNSVGDDVGDQVASVVVDGFGAGV